MDPGGEKHQVLGDYAALLRAFLPEARGFHCYGRDGASIWSEEPQPAVRLTREYRAALKCLLPGTRGGTARVDLDGAVAYLVTLRNERGEPLGVLALLLPAGAAALTAEACAELVLPATRTLERELSLRVRLLEGYRKLNVQAAEERLLHEVERAVQGPADCPAMLERILKLCRHHLEVDSAALLIPGKHITLTEGERFSRAELDMLLDAEPDGAESGISDLYTARIRGADRAVIGVLALAGWKGPEFSLRRRSRVGRYLATHIETVLERSFDPLTGLPAWPIFEKGLAAALVAARAAGGGDPPALMYCDIDRLHVANDTLGPEAGDRVLASFAVILREELKGHAITRVASDRFVALLRDTDLDEARRLAEAVSARFRRLEFGQGERSYRASVSIGIGLAALDAASPATGDGPGEGGALSTAMVACSAAKDRGRGRVEVYEPADLSIVQRFDDIQLVGYIRNAIERSRLALMAQPIVAIRPPAGAPDTACFEVLVRLLDEENQHISPSEFLSAAERYQMMEELDRWVVANTLSLLGGFAATHAHARTRFAINLSGQSLGSEPFLGFVQQQLAQSGVPPEMVCFEITETVAVANLQRAQAFMHTLRRSGCRFSLDDFGTGLSSFAYLKLFPVDTLKIDGSFIRDLSTNVVSQSVVAAISEVARVMQLETVAEFVEDRTALELLGKLGITRAQGYLLGEPSLLAGQLALLGAEPSRELLPNQPAERRRR
ncbi:MAG: EAL domain-containing protein [Chromatiales bacterium]|nr:EAL domain-containing protein [Chromatiales bacterium]